MTAVKTIDAHVGGQPLRLIVEGCPAPRGRTMADRREWLVSHADAVRTLLVNEPRGHQDMTVALLTEPVHPGSDAGLLFMDSSGAPPLSGHGIIAAATIAVEHGLITSASGVERLVFDTPAGTIRTRIDGRRVTFAVPPSFVMHAGVEVAVGAKRVRTDVAFGGLFYAIVDSESVGLPVHSRHHDQLRRIGREVVRAVNTALTVVHPSDATWSGVHAAILTSPPQGDADLRSVVVDEHGALDRSACGSGTAAIMAVIDAMGLLDASRPFVHEGIVGTILTGRLKERTQIGERPAIVPEIEGTAWITGEHRFVLEPGDTFPRGFQLRS